MEATEGAMIRHTPRETLHLMRVLMGVGTATSVGMLLYSLPTVYRTWWETRVGVLHRCLYYWLGGVCAIQLVALPLRVRLAGRLAVDVRLPRDRLVAHMQELAQSLEWRVNKYAGNLAYWLFIVGSCITSYERAWAANAAGAAEEANGGAEIMATTMVALLAMAARIAFSFCYFLYNFAYGTEGAAATLSPGGRLGADDEMLRIYLRQYDWPAAAPATAAVVADAAGAAGAAGAGAGGAAAPDAGAAAAAAAAGADAGGARCDAAAAPCASCAVPPPADEPLPAGAPAAGATAAPAMACAVCLNDFVAGERVAALPCSSKHVFHVVCLVPWLRMQKKCPLCNHEIDDVRPSPPSPVAGAGVKEKAE